VSVSDRTPAGRGRFVVPATGAYPLAVASAVFILAVGLPSTDSDTYWHLATGRWMLDHQSLLQQDIFSSTVNGTPFGVGEWLGQLFFAAAFAAAGWPGIAVLRATLLGVAAFFLCRLARRGGTPWWISLPLVIAALLVSKITWTDRPQLFNLALFPVLLDLLLSRTGHASRWWLLMLPPLFLVWANLHAGYLVGIAVLAAITLHELIVSGRRALPLAAVAVASVALTFVNPAPVELAGATRLALLQPPRFITEYLPPDVLTPAGAIFAGFILAVLGSAMLRGGSLREAMLLVPLLLLAFTAQRHMVFFCFAATAFVGPRLLALVPVPPRLPAVPALASAAIAAILLAAAVASATAAPAQPDESAYPSGALAALRDDRGVLLNEYDWGGYLIFRLPERPVFIDGRYVPYLGGVLDDYRALIALRPGWRDLLAKYAVAEVLLAPDRPLAVALREDGWRLRAEDRSGRWVVLARP
jgi:hypothetical protein